MVGRRTGGSSPLAPLHDLVPDSMTFRPDGSNTTREAGREPGAAGDRVLLGIGLMLASVALLPFMEGLAKVLTDRYSVVQIVFARFAFQFLIIFPLAAWRHPLQMRRPARLPLQIVRGLSILVATGLFYSALAVMPLVDALALLFVAPLIVTALSPAVLGETVGARLWVAVLIGFVGVLVILRPGFGVFQSGALLALAGGACIAGYALITRHLSQAAPPLVTLAITSLVGLTVAGSALPFVWVTPDLGDWARMAVIGGISAVGHYLMIRAFEQAPASIVTPFIYAEMIMTTVLGYLWFNDFPDAMTWTGIAILIGSGVFISLQGHRRG